jgi:hypothetical protein
MFMYSYAPIHFYLDFLLVRHAAETFVAAAVLLSLFLALNSWDIAPTTRRLIEWSRAHRFLAAVPIALVSFPVAFYLSFLGGQMHAQDVRRNFDTFVQFVLKRDAKVPESTDFSYFNSIKDLNIIIETRDAYFAFQQKAPAQDGSLLPGLVFKVPRDDVVVVETVMREE